MTIPRSGRKLGVLSLAIVWTCLSFGEDQSTTAPTRDSHCVEILTRVVQSAGGQVSTTVRDMSESGEITFHGDDKANGPVKIHVLDGSRFRMEASLPHGRTVWIVRNGVGTKKQDDKSFPFSHLQAANLVNLTTPFSYATAALADMSSDLSFVGIEKLGTRSVYRIRLKGQLGLSSDSSHRALVRKDLLVDVLTFDILSVEDRPFAAISRVNKRVATRSTTQPEAAARHVDYSDFREIEGLRVPFSISVKLLGQPTLDIRLQSVSINTGLTDQSFRD